MGDEWKYKELISRCYRAPQEVEEVCLVVMALQTVIFIGQLV